MNWTNQSKLILGRDAFHEHIEKIACLQQYYIERRFKTKIVRKFHYTCWAGLVVIEKWKIQVLKNFQKIKIKIIMRQIGQKGLKSGLIALLELTNELKLTNLYLS